MNTTDFIREVLGVYPQLKKVHCESMLPTEFSLVSSFLTAHINKKLSEIRQNAMNIATQHASPVVPLYIQDFHILAHCMLTVDYRGGCFRCLLVCLDHRAVLDEALGYNYYTSGGRRNNYASVHKIRS